MSLGEAIRTVVGRYADFEGRASRPELWWWLLFVTLVAAALDLLSVVSIGDAGNLGSLWSGLWGIAVLAVLWSQPATSSVTALVDDGAEVTS